MRFSVRSCIAIIVLSFCIGCVTRTEFGRRRPVATGRSVAATDPKIYNFIDTAKLYGIVSATEIPANIPLTSVNKTWLKFYADGRVGTFYDPASLNPKRADIGYYEYRNNTLAMCSFFEHPQGGGWVRDQAISFRGDTLLISSQHIVSKYLPVAIPASSLVYKPDW